MTLPQISSDRLTQMIHLATSYKQEHATVTLPWYQGLLQKLHSKSTRLVYGIGATAVSFSCIGAFWVIPLLTTQTEVATSDFSISEYMMQDLLEDLS
jgi:hypothetical protein